MDQDLHHGSPAIRLAFLERLAADRAAGEIRPLEGYQALFPGYEAEIAAEYAVITGQVEHDSTPAWLAGESSLEKIGPGQKFAHYQVGRELGRGGQGVVFLATDTRLNRPVALKVLYGLGLLSRSSLARFQREAELAGKLADPGICTIYDAGVAEGVPYIAMRYLEGETLARRLALWRDRSQERPLIPEILELIIQVATSLHAAHERGVLHRDIKPGNIMVMPDQRPVLLDFGLARDLQGQQESLTGSATRLGTPAYMAPEQLAIQRAEPDRRTDVFSLGVVLFEALTLEKPFQEISLAGLRRDVQLPPPRNPRKLNHDVGRNLRAVLDKALAADRRERYATAGAFAADLERIRQNARVAVRSAGPVRRFRRWTRRSPVVAGLTVGLFALLVVALAVFVVLYTHAEDARRTSERERYRAIITAVPPLLAAGQFAEACRLLSTCPADQIAWEHRYLQAETEPSRGAFQVGPTEVRLLWPHGPENSDNPDNSENSSNPEERWHVLTGAGESMSIRLRGNASVSGDRRSLAPSTYAAALDPGGNWLAIVTRQVGTDLIQVHNARTGACVGCLSRPAESVHRVAVTPDGENVLFVAGALRASKRIFRWNCVTNCVVPFNLMTTESGDIADLAVDRHGHRAAAAIWHKSSALRGVFLFDPKTGQITGRLEESSRYVRAVAFSSDGRRLVTAAGRQTDQDGGVIRIWDLCDLKPLASILHAYGTVTCLAVHPDDRSILAGTRCGAIHVHDGGLQRRSGTFLGLEREVTTLQFDTCGQRVVAGDRGGNIRYWDVGRSLGPAVLDTDQVPIFSLAFDASGDRLVVGAAHRSLDVWDLNRLCLVDARETGLHSQVALDPDGRSVWMWSLGEIEPTKRVDLDTGTSEPWIAAEPIHAAGPVAFDLAHEQILSAGPAKHEVVVYSRQTCTVTHRLAGLTARPDQIVVNRAGTHVVARAGHDSPEPQVAVWAPGNSSARPVWQSRDRASALALGPNGRWLAVGNEVGEVRIVELDRPDHLEKAVAFPGDRFALAFDPTGQRLAVVADTVVTLVDPESGRILLHLPELPGPASTIAFSANGDRLAVACTTGQIVVYETAAARRRAWSMQDDPDRRDLDVERARTSVQDAWAKQGNAVDVALDLRRRLHDPAQRWQRIACRMAALRADDCVRAGKRFCDSLKTISRWNSPRLWYAMIDAEQKLCETAVVTSEAEQRNQSARQGLILTGLCRWTEAEVCLLQVVPDLDRPARAPVENIYRQALARCLWHTGRQEEAREIDPDVKQHAARAEQSPPPSWFDAFAWHVARVPDQAPDQYQQALAWAREACGREDRAVFRVTRGAVLQRLGRPAEALAELEAARERFTGTDHPRRAVLAAFAFLCHLAMGQEKEAGSQFNEFVVCRNTASLTLHPDVILLDREVRRALEAK